MNCQVIKLKGFKYFLLNGRCQKVVVIDNVPFCADDFEVGYTLKFKRQEPNDFEFIRMLENQRG